MAMPNLISFAGIFLFIAIAWLFSADRRRMNWRVIGWGVFLQLAVGAGIFTLPAGGTFFLFLNDAVIRVMDSAAAGAAFVFGRLAVPPGQIDAQGQASLGFILAFQAFPTIIFFSSLISILYFFRIMPAVVRSFAYVFTRLMKVSGAESLVTACNIFAGVESTLAIKPYLARMTLSELCVVLTAGMATVSSNILALYVFSLKPYFPTIAGHLISASLLSAPAALVMAKVIMPEKGRPETLGLHIKPCHDEAKSFFEAILSGAHAGVRMIIGITALLIAVLGLVALADLILHFVGARINLLCGLRIDWALKSIAGYLCYPFTLIMGVDPHDAGLLARIIGERLIVTEVVSYQDLAAALSGGMLADPRSAIIASYALCGFAHLASMAIFVGGVSAIVPSRTADLTRVALRALLAATLACCMTACVAGTFCAPGSFLWGK